MFEVGRPVDNHGNVIVEMAAALGIDHVACLARSLDQPSFLLARNDLVALEDRRTEDLSPSEGGARVLPRWHRIVGVVASSRAAIDDLARMYPARPDHATRAGHLRAFVAD